MKHLTTVLILILVSSNASKYSRPNHQFQQDPTNTKDKYQEPIMDSAFDDDDDRFFPRVSSTDEGTRWESPPDEKILLQDDLEALENLLEEEDPNDWKMKRTGPSSLSIVNPLDVLRDQYSRSMNRKMKFKSFENRDQLGSAGKRSRIGDRFQLNPGKRLPFPRKMTRKSYFENGLGERDTRLIETRNEPNPPSRRYQSRLNGLSYQT